ncbi:hypothetical protein HK101_009752 [Irineochytrium annulatum]|nr:hypothetical protein HK101_009752 [Irineochytrium annulatum]
MAASVLRKTNRQCDSSRRRAAIHSQLECTTNYLAKVPRAGTAGSTTTDASSVLDRPETPCSTLISQGVIRDLVHGRTFKVGLALRISPDPATVPTDLKLDGRLHADVVVRGWFDRLHDGHRRVLDIAARFCRGTVWLEVVGDPPLPPAATRARPVGGGAVTTPVVGGPLPPLTAAGTPTTPMTGEDTLPGWGKRFPWLIASKSARQATALAYLEARCKHWANGAMVKLVVDDVEGQSLWSVKDVLWVYGEDHFGWTVGAAREKGHRVLFVSDLTGTRASTIRASEVAASFER